MLRRRKTFFISEFSHKEIKSQQARLGLGFVPSHRDCKSLLLLAIY